jgi:hypothetical protein
VSVYLLVFVQFLFCFVLCVCVCVCVILCLYMCVNECVGLSVWLCVCVSFCVLYQCILCVYLSLCVLLCVARWAKENCWIFVFSFFCGLSGMLICAVCCGISVGDCHSRVEQRWIQSRTRAALHLVLGECTILAGCRRRRVFGMAKLSGSSSHRYAHAPAVCVLSAKCGGTLLNSVVHCVEPAPTQSNSLESL